MNHATKITAAVWGVLLGVSSISHGFFEVLQGNLPTNSLFIAAIGKNHQMWEYGSEPALTVIPNFLITGMLAMLVGLMLITWAIRFLHTEHGAIILLLLFVLSVLVGGGIAQVLIFPVVYLIATRINQPLVWWRDVMPSQLRNNLANSWQWLLGLSSLFLLNTLVVATFGVFPGVSDAQQLLNIMLLSLVMGYGMYLLSAIAGFAYDVQKRFPLPTPVPMK